MSEQLFTSLASILTAIIGVAIISVLVSKNANTAGVLTAGGSAFAQDLSVAISPVAGGSVLGGFSGNSLNFNTSGFH